MLKDKILRRVAYNIDIFYKQNEIVFFLLLNIYLVPILA